MQELIDWIHPSRMNYSRYVSNKKILLSKIKNFLT